MKKSSGAVGKPIRNSGTKKLSGKNEIGITYSDKSAGQPKLLPVFESIKKLFLDCVQKSLVARGGKDGQMLLVCENLEKEIFFAGLLIQKGYVGFYLSALTILPELRNTIKPELLKCLKGKTCFYIRTDDKEIYAQIKHALATSKTAYKKQGWIA